MQLLIWISRILVGALFIFSGFIKANDALGFSYKLEEYFEKFSSIFNEHSLGWLAYPMDLMAHFAFPLAVAIVVVEMTLGVLTLIGAFMEKVSKYLLVMIIFFTFLTFVSWYFEIVKTCGCFGEAIPLTPFQSFLKDVLLILLILVLFIFRKSMTSFLSPSGDKIALWSSTFIGFLFTWYCFQHLPVMDFRPYAVGNHILPQMQPIKGNPLTLYQLKHKESGVEVKLADLPMPFDPWEYIEAVPVSGELKVKEIEMKPSGFKTRVVEIPDQFKEDWQVLSESTEEFIPDQDPKIMQLSAFDYKSSDQDYLEEMLLDSSYYFWLVIRDFNKLGQFVQADDGKVFMPSSSGLEFSAYLKRLNKDGSAAGVKLYGMVSEGIPEHVSAFRQAMSASFPFYICDDTELKTMIRSSPGLLLLHGDQVVGKWHENDFPDFNEIQNQYINQ